MFTKRLESLDKYINFINSIISKFGIHNIHRQLINKIFSY